VLLITGKDDPVTTADEAIQIASWLGHSGQPDAHYFEPSLRPSTLQSRVVDTPDHLPRTPNPNPSHPPSKLVILPSPASHAILYSPLTVRPVSSLIQNFLSSAVSHRLSLGWQLQHLTTEGKWDVKNLQKWTAVEPVSRPIANVFRAMKTLREADGTHTPRTFVHDWAPDRNSSGTGKDRRGAIVAVVDISHDSPVYDPAALEQGGIVYRKFPTVSKMPPTTDEVRHFIDLIDHLRTELHLLLPVDDDDAAAAATEGDADRLPSRLNPSTIAVHCHYGFNRTGFFLIAYLVERLGWPLGDAIEEFARRRPPGVRHPHFVDELWGRYWDWGDARSAESEAPTTTFVHDE
jgi:hypothetical protein